MVIVDMNFKKICNGIIIFWGLKYLDFLDFLRPVMNLMFIELILLIVFGVIVLYQKQLKDFLRKENYIFIFFLVLMLLGKQLRMDSWFDMQFYGMYSWFVAYNFYIYCSKNNTYTDNKIIIFSLVVPIVISCLISIIALMNYPGIARMSASMSDVELTKYYLLPFNGNFTFLISDFPYIYILPIIFLLLFDIALRKNKVTISLALIILLNLLFSQYTIVLISMIIALLYYIYGTIYEKIGMKKTYISIIIICLIISILVTILWSCNALPGAIQRLLNDIIYCFQNGELTGRVLSRVIVYVESFDAALYNKFIYAPANQVGSGHTAVLDFIAYFGVFSVVLFYSIIVMLKNVYSYLDRKDKLVYIAIILYFIIVCLLNPVFTGKSAISMFLIVPFFSTIFRKKFKENKATDDKI